ncbi:MAG TPA: hypothetical protein VM534_08680 [Thermoanaerobaculia bacterium]|nr:hypothetical protein [Thermoanaerobaculia bacterium]
MLTERLPFLISRARFSDYHQVARPSGRSLQALGSLRPIDDRSVGAWRRHLPRVAGQLLLHGSITADLIRHGYEKDAAWESLLDGVEPDTSPSHQRDRFTLRLHWRLRRGRYLEAVRTLFRRWRSRRR